MKTINISGSPRANVGSKDAKALRLEDNIPCVLYGGKEQVHFYANEKQFKPLVYTPDIATVKLELGGKTYEAIMQDIQYHKVNDKITHVDFLEVVPGKALTMEVPLKFNGTSPGVRAGGKLLKKLRTLSVRGPIEKIPQLINIDISKLELGKAISVADIKIEGTKLLNSPSATIVAARITRNVTEEAKPAAGAAAAPAADAKAADPKAAAAKPDAKAAAPAAAKPAAKK